ncbi:MAG: DUF2520 domain-containing protein [Acidobacteriota bacterium]|nr:DUF2520 domain-containing protein [Acidobacteriota bacterium]
MALPSLTLVGPGRAGRAFLRSWLSAGGSVDAVLERGRVPASVSSDVLVLAVPDDAISSVGAAIAPSARCRFAFHLSGALASEAIAPLRGSGAAIGSFHPLRAFRGEEGETLAGAFVAIEGDPAACDAADRFARALGAAPHRIAREAKPLYHAAATIAAGGSVALVSAAARAWAAAGIPEPAARAALAGLAADAVAGVAGRPFFEAFTGPVARRDIGTVRSHLSALENSPELRRLYVLLARETLARTPGPESDDEIRALLTC